MDDPGQMRSPGRAGLMAALKRLGPVAVEELAGALGISGAAVRQQLGALEADGLARASPVAAAGRGRPKCVWQLTAAAEPAFPDTHRQLAADLIRQMQAAFGPDGLDGLLAARTAGQEAAYGAQMARATSLKGRLAVLARIRSREGYMAEIKANGRGGYWLIEHHCPVCAAARLCQGLCREELVLFRRLLGKAVRVERVAHALGGDLRCIYDVNALDVGRAICLSDTLK